MSNPAQSLQGAVVTGDERPAKRAKVKGSPASSPSETNGKTLDLPSGNARPDTPSDDGVDEMYDTESPSSKHEPKASDLYLDTVRQPSGVPFT